MTRLLIAVCGRKTNCAPRIVRLNALIGADFGPVSPFSRNPRDLLRLPLSVSVTVHYFAQGVTEVGESAQVGIGVGWVTDRGRLGQHRGGNKDVCRLREGSAESRL